MESPLPTTVLCLLRYLYLLVFYAIANSYSEDGTLSLFDAMKGGNSAPLWTLAAHNKATSAVAINTQLPIFATGSTDRTIKVSSY